MMEISPLTPHIGAEICGVDLSQPMDDATFATLRQAHLDWLVLVFRDQHLSREQHKSFAEKFGRLHCHPMNYRGTDDNAILTVKTTADSAYTAGNGWHTDVTCDEYPTMGSMLYMHETPEGGGGDTLFADMYLAYELLSAPLRDFLSTLSAVHDGALPYVNSYKSVPPDGGYARNEHPVIVTHPETGKKVLFVNAGFTSHIVGLKPQESKMLLRFLFDHVASIPRLTCRVSWQPNTLTFWDNRCTQHHAVWDYYPHSRYGERVSIVAGSKPFC